MKRGATLLAICFAVCLGTFKISAQNFEMQMRPDSVSGIDFNFRKILISDAGLSFFSGNFDLKYRHVFGDKLNMVASLNYSKFESDQFGESLGGLGNAYLGFQMKNSYSEKNQNAIELGVFVPTADEEAFIGAFGNYYDLPRYVDGAYGVRLSYQSFYDYDGGFSFGYELGPDLMISTEEFSSDDLELLFRYGLNLSYSSSGFQIMTELLGLAVLTEEGSFDENTIHGYAAGLSYKIGKFVPRVYYKDYFDEDVGDSIDGILGIGFYLLLD